MKISEILRSHLLAFGRRHVRSATLCDSWVSCFLLSIFGFTVPKISGSEQQHTSEASNVYEGRSNWHINQWHWAADGWHLEQPTNDLRLNDAADWSACNHYGSNATIDWNQLGHPQQSSGESGRRTNARQCWWRPEQLRNNLHGQQNDAGDQCQ